MKKIAIAILAILLLSLAVPVLAASDISGALYSGTVRATNNSTSAASNVSTTFTANTSDLIDAGLLNATATNATIRNSTGADTKFMPGVSGNPWVVFFDSVLANGSKDYYLYTDTVTGATPVYFPGSTGVAIADDATMEPSDNFSVQLSGYFDTSYPTANTTYADKPNAFRIYNGASGNITAQTANWTRLASNVNDGWTDPENAYDSLTATYAEKDQPLTSWTGYLQVNQSANTTQATRIRIWVTRETADINNMELDLYYNAGWHNLVTGVPSSFGAYVEYPISTTYDVTAMRVRFYNNDAGANRWVRLHDVQFLNLDFIEVSASGISSGDDVKVSMDSPFLSLAPDDPGGTITPVGSPTLNAPLWQTECSSSPFTTIDSNAFTGTVTGATWTNQGYDFNDATGDDIDLGADVGYTNGAFTVIIWFYPHTPDEDFTCLFSLRADADNYLNLFYRNTFYRVATNFEANNVLASTNSADNAFPLNTWGCLGVTWNGTDTFQNYANGAVSGSSGSQAQTPVGVHGLTLAQVRTVAQNFDGIIGEVQIYDGVAFTPAQILQQYNATKSKYTTGDIYTVSTLASVPNNANDWIVGYGGDALKYMDTFSFTQGGIERCNLSWEYGTTFTDATGNGNDGTPSFRTTSSDPDVSASLLNFGPISQSTASDVADTWPTMVTSAPDEPSTMYTENTTPGFFFSPLITLISDYSDGKIPASLIYYLMCFTIILIAGVLSFYIIADKAKQGALLLKIIVMGAFMIFFALPGLNVYGFYVVIYFAMWCFGILVLSRNFGW